MKFYNLMTAGKNQINIEIIIILMQTVHIKKANQRNTKAIIKIMNVKP